MTVVEYTKIRWNKDDIEWLSKAVDDLEADGYVSTANDLRKEVDKLRNETC